jgi:hypothetical protein
MAQSTPSTEIFSVNHDALKTYLESLDVDEATIDEIQDIDFFGMMIGAIQSKISHRNSKNCVDENGDVVDSEKLKFLIESICETTSHHFKHCDIYLKMIAWRHHNAESLQALKFFLENYELSCRKEMAEGVVPVMGDWRSVFNYPIFTVWTASDLFRIDTEPVAELVVDHLTAIFGERMTRVAEHYFSRDYGTDKCRFYRPVDLVLLRRFGATFSKDALQRIADRTVADDAKISQTRSSHLRKDLVTFHRYRNYPSTYYDELNRCLAGK